MGFQDSPPSSKKLRTDYRDKIELCGQLKFALRMLKQKMEVRNIWRNGEGKELCVSLGNLVLIGLDEDQRIEWYILGYAVLGCSLFV